MLDGDLTTILRYPLARVVLPVAFGLAGGVVLVLIAAKLSPIIALAACVAIVGGLVLLKQPVWGLYALAFAVPLERFGRLSDDTTNFNISVSRGLGMACFGVVIVRHFVMHKDIYVSRHLILWAFFAAFGAMTLFYTTDFDGGIKIAGGYIGNILFLFVLLNLMLAPSFKESFARIETSIYAWLGASMLIAMYSIYDWHLGSGAGDVIQVGEVDPQAGAQVMANRWSTVWYDSAETETLGGGGIRRSMGSTSHAAVFGINLAMTIPFFFYVLKTNTNKVIHAIVWAGLAMTAYCTLLNNTRAALLLVVGVVGLCVLLGLLRITIWLVLSGIAVVAAAPLFIPVDIFKRVLDFNNYTSGKSEAMRIRIDYWGSGLRAFGENWIAGNGLANQKIAVEYLRNPIPGKSHMHNIYLQTLVDVGIFGWMLFVTFLASIVYTCLRARKNFRTLEMPNAYWLATAAFVLVVGVLVYGLQVDVLYFPLKGFWLIVGVIIVMGRYSETLRMRNNHVSMRQEAEIS